MFQKCDFILGNGSSVVIVIPTVLPYAENYTVSVSENDIKFKAGYDEIAFLNYDNHEIYDRIAQHTQVGLVEHRKDADMPDYITNVAYVEVRKGN